MKTESLLSCIRLNAGYGRKTVLHDISAAFSPGTLTILAGPNGCGKSTLLQCLVGTLPLQSGEITLCGKKLSAYAPLERARLMTFLPQFRIPTEVSAFSAVLSGRFPYLSFPRRYGESDRAAALDALRAVGAEQLRDRPVRELSGGERQKVYLAAALAQDTEILLLDEPCTGLDIGAELDLLELLKELAKKGKTVILSHHNLTTALETADRVIVMKNGKVLAEGEVGEVLDAVEEAFGVKVHRIPVSQITVNGSSLQELPKETRFSVSGK